jgi:chorismate--pyruvate lyase
MGCNLNRHWQWYDVPPVPVGDPFHSWVTNQGSLTSRLCAISEEFQVIVHHNRFEKAYPDETFLLSASNDAQGASTLVREVSLVCDGIPLVFGRSILMTRESGPLARLVEQAGNNSLGVILFACPDIQRGPFHFKRINWRHALYAKSVTALGDHPNSFFLARRSVFSLQSEQICVTEVFSPQLVIFSRLFKKAS